MEPELLHSNLAIELREATAADAMRFLLRRKFVRYNNTSTPVPSRILISSHMIAQVHEDELSKAYQKSYTLTIVHKLRGVILHKDTVGTEEKIYHSHH